MHAVKDPQPEKETAFWLVVLLGGVIWLLAPAAGPWILGALAVYLLYRALT